MELHIKFSIVILTHHRISLIQRCLDSIFRELGQTEDYEILSLINGVDSETLHYYQKMKRNHENFQFYQIDKSVTVGEARNIVIDKAKGKYICFLDDDVEVSKNYFHKALKFIQDFPETDVFGGPDQTKTNASDFQKVLGEVMKSFLAMGPTAKRHYLYGENKKKIGNELNLILCNLWIKKTVFDQGYKFPVSYRRNEENILLSKLKDNGYNLFYTCDLVVFHERKSSFKKLINSTYTSGYYRTIGFFDQKGTFKFVFLIPQILLIIMTGLIFINIKLFIISFLFYLFIVSINSFKIAMKLKMMPKVFLAMGFFIVYNISYTLGLFMGYKSLVTKNGK